MDGGTRTKFARLPGFAVLGNIVPDFLQKSDRSPTETGQKFSAFSDELQSDFDQIRWFPVHMDCTDASSS